jgi:hypothetical protein
LPKQSEGFTEAERRLHRSGAKALPKQSEGFTEAERRLHRSGAKASPKRSEGIGSADADAAERHAAKEAKQTTL